MSHVPETRLTLTTAPCPKLATVLITGMLVSAASRLAVMARSDLWVEPMPRKDDLRCVAMDSGEPSVMIPTLALLLLKKLLSSANNWDYHTLVMEKTYI